MPQRDVVIVADMRSYADALHRSGEHFPAKVIERLLAAVESVLGLHKPETRYTAAGWEEVSFESRVDAAEYGDTDNVQEFKVCHECGLIETHDGGEERCYEYSIWPCATVRALEAALGGSEPSEEGNGQRESVPSLNGGCTHE